MRGELLPYKLIGDIAYPMKPWFYSPFKGEKEGLPRAKCHWNFIQSSTRMVVERTFGILNSRWRIILKRVDMSLRHVPNLVTVCICLHNFCIIHKNKFDLDWAKEGERLMLRESLERIGQLKKPDIFMAAAEAAKEMRHLLGLEEGIVPTETLDELDDINDEDTQKTVETKEERETRVKNMLVQATKAHELMTNTFWEAHLRAEKKIFFPKPSSDFEEY
jgi:hypothetical protein